MLALLCGAGRSAGLPGGVFDPLAFGAKADGRANDTAAIQQAIDACARAGGGTVYLAPGNFLAGTLVLKSNVTLYLAAGATLWGSRNFSDYSLPHLLYACDAENVTIEGEGTINGNGDAFWTAKFKAKPQRPTPLIELVRCRNVRLHDVRIRNQPGWGVHPWQCDGVYISGLSIINDMRSPNTDGIDPDSSRNVFISDCFIETGDDAICLKTDKQSAARPCENVTVDNCVLTSDDSAIKLGTASWGDFRDCTFANCVITGARYGIAMYIKDGALVEGIHFANITIDTAVARENALTGAHRAWTEYPIFLDLEQRDAASALGRLRDISFSDISIRTQGPVLVGGPPERPLENLSFHNLSIRVTGLEPVAGQHKPRGVARIRPAPRETDYSDVPAALIFANIKGLDLRDLRVTWDLPPENCRSRRKETQIPSDSHGEPGRPPYVGSYNSQTRSPLEDRHALYACQVEDLALDGFMGGPCGAGLAAIGLEKTKRVTITAARPDAGTAVFVGLRDVPEQEVSLSANRFASGTEPMKQGGCYQRGPYSGR